MAATEQPTDLRADPAMLSETAAQLRRRPGPLELTPLEPRGGGRHCDRRRDRRVHRSYNGAQQYSALTTLRPPRTRTTSPSTTAPTTRSAPTPTSPRSRNPAHAAHRFRTTTTATTRDPPPDLFADQGVDCATAPIRTG